MTTIEEIKFILDNWRVFKNSSFISNHFPSNEYLEKFKSGSQLEEVLTEFLEKFDELT